MPTFVKNPLFPLTDLEGDGIQEFAEVTVTFPTGGGPKSTVIDIFSGPASVFRFQVLRNGLDYEARDIEVLGDVDDDGYEDFGVYAFLGDPQIGSGTYVFECLSGFDGSTIHYLSSSTVRVDGMAAMGDIDGDGHDDFALSSRNTSLLYVNGGSATIFSGVDLTPIHSWFGQQVDDALGIDIVSIADIDGDDKRDLVVLAPGPHGAHGTLGTIGHVRAYSSATAASSGSCLPT